MKRSMFNNAKPDHDVLVQVLLVAKSGSSQLIDET